METFADRLRTAIRDSGKTQQEVADATEISKSLISSYLAGRFKARSTNLHILAYTLNVSEAWLMGYDVPRERDKTLDAPRTEQPAPSLSSRELALLDAYRRHPELQSAVDRMLEVQYDADETEEEKNVSFVYDPINVIREARKRAGLKTKL